MNKVKFAYDWIGPNGPIPNNESPNLLQLINVSTDAKPNVASNIKYFTTTLDKRVVSKNPDIMEITGTCGLQENDFFIYPFELTHKSSLESYFSAGHSPGLLELSNLLSPGSPTMHGIKAGNGYILIHFTYEAYVNFRLFGLMHEYFNYHGVPLNKIIYQTGTPDAYRLYQEYCDQTGQVNKMLVCFWDTNEYNLSQIYQNTSYEGVSDFSNIQKTFLCLNRRYRWHRNALFTLFYKYDLLKDSYFSMPKSHADHTGQVWKDQCDHGFLNTHGVDPEILQQLLPLVVDNLDYQNMVQDMTRRMKLFYESSLINVTTETTYDSYAPQISEKTYKPIFYKQPFIMVNSPNSLRYLRNAGYKTFSDFFDEGYDEVVNERERIERIGELCKTINEWSVEIKQKFFLETRDIVNHNLQVLYDVFPKKLKGEFWDLLRNRL